MTFIFEPAFWILLAASLSAWAGTSFIRSIGKLRMAAMLTVWVSATGTTLLLFGTFAAILSATASTVIGLTLLIATLLWSGVKSMPNRRFEEH